MKIHILIATIFFTSCHIGNGSFCNVKGKEYKYNRTNGDYFVYSFDKTKGNLSIKGPHRLLDEQDVSEISVYHKYDQNYFQFGTIIVPKNIFNMESWSINGVECVKQNQINNLISVRCDGNRYAGHVIYLYKKEHGIISFTDYLVNGDVNRYDIEGKKGIAELCG
jgi:hypothetical protein